MTEGKCFKNVKMFAIIFPTTEAAVLFSISFTMLGGFNYYSFLIN